MFRKIGTPVSRVLSTSAQTCAKRMAFNVTPFERAMVLGIFFLKFHFLKDFKNLIKNFQTA